MHVLQLAHLRRETYRLLGALLMYPSEPNITGASEAARHLRRRDRRVAELAFYGPWERFLRRVECLTATQVGELQERYLSVFAGSTLAEPVPLFECGYLDQAATASGQVIADLEKHYASAGLSVSADGVETPDHAAVEMEFVAFLCGQETEAWEVGDLAGALEAIGHQRSFLKDHPCRWLALLSRAVGARDAAGLYGLTTRAARAMAAHDAGFLGIVAERLRAEPRGS